MARSKTITLKGAAAGAYIHMMRGDKPKSQEDGLLRVATLVHMHMKREDTERAVLVLKRLTEVGLEQLVKEIS